MQPDIPALDRFFIRFATHRGLRFMAWALVAAVLLAARSWYLLWLVAFVPLAHLYGAWVLKQYHPLLAEKLAEAMEASARADCGLGDEDETHLLLETCGSIGPGPLAGLPASMNATLVAPLADCAVISRHAGTIFPPRWLHPLEFRHQCDGQTEVYYSDVNYVEGDSKRLVLHFSSGSSFELGGGEGAPAAVAALRKKLRRHKSPSQAEVLYSDDK